MNHNINDVYKAVAKGLPGKPPGIHANIDEINDILDKIPAHEPEPTINGHPKQYYYSVYKTAKNINDGWATLYLLALAAEVAAGLMANGNSGLEFVMVLATLITIGALVHGTVCLWMCHQLDIDYTGSWEDVATDEPEDSSDPLLDAMRERIHDRHMASRVHDGTPATSLQIEVTALERSGANTDNLHRITRDVVFQLGQQAEQLHDAVAEANRQREVLESVLSWLKSQGYSKEFPPRAKIEELFK